MVQPMMYIMDGARMVVTRMIDGHDSASFTINTFSTIEKGITFAGMMRQNEIISDEIVSDHQRSIIIDRFS